MNSASAAAGSAAAAGTDGRSARWEHHRAVRRRALIKSARRVVHELGAAVSMEDIASAAGTSKSVYYRYFQDRAGLQRAMGEVVLARMQERVLEAGRNAATPREGLHAMVSAYLQTARSSPNVYMFVTQVGAGDAPGPSASPDILAHFFETVSGFLARPMRSLLADTGTGSDGGCVADVGTTLAFWPRAAIGMVRAAGEQWLAAPPGPARPSEQEMAELLTSWLFNGIAGKEQH